jgi:hypothetical protein
LLRVERLSGEGHGWPSQGDWDHAREGYNSLATPGNRVLCGAGD